MTEISRPWAGTTVGDAGPYTAPMWWDVWQAMMGGSGAVGGAGNKGVVARMPGRLNVTYVGPNFLSVAVGTAIIDGLFYYNNAVYSVTVSSAATGKVRDDRLVVRKYFGSTTQTARIVLLAGSEIASPGLGTPPAITQDATRTTYWDLPLARVSVTDAGVITLTDEREYVDAEVRKAFFPALVGYDDSYQADIIRKYDFVSPPPSQPWGVELPDSRDSNAIIVYQVPYDAVPVEDDTGCKQLDMSTVVNVDSGGGGGGNMVIEVYDYIGQYDVSYGSLLLNSGQITVANAGVLKHQTVNHTDLSQVSAMLAHAHPGDTGYQLFRRRGELSGDTLSTSLCVHGVLMEYLAWK